MKGDRKQIGTVTIEYDANGQTTSAEFQPAKVDIINPHILASRLRTVRIFDDVKDNADTVFAEWFNVMNNIELADREKFKIESEILECKTFPDNKVRKFQIRYSQVEL